MKALALLALLAVATSPALAQDRGFSLPSQAVVPQAQAQAAPQQPRQPRPQRPRQNDADRAFMGGGLVLESSPFGQQAARAPAPNPRGELAPRPNLNMDGPRETQPGFMDPNQTRITPSLISPRIPGRGMAQDGSMGNRIEDRFIRTPAAGAHLRMPMSW